LTFSNGLVVGIVLGYAISPDGMMLEGRYKLPISTRSAASLAQAEKYIAQLAGRYVVLLSIGQNARVYSDPTCSLGPVYNSALKCLGASTALVLDRPVIDNPDVSAQSVTEGKARYLFGNTVDRDVKRAMSNHYINLSDFTLHRHWPTEDTPFELGDRPWQDVSREITEKLGSNMNALSKRYATALPISGGTDSRILLAAARDCLDQIREFFVYQTNWATVVDAEIALEIAQQMSLPLRVITRDSHSFKAIFSDQDHETHMQLRHLRGGFEPDTSEVGSIRAMQLIPKDRLILRGNIAEMSRALRWKRFVFDDPHNTAFALKKLFVPNDPDSTFYKASAAAFLRWKENLPAPAVARIYDMLHTELWMPHTNSAVYLREADHVMINPYNDRHIIHLTSMIHPHTRKVGRVVKDMVARNAQELSQIEFSADRVVRQREERQNEENVA
jgi:hypothetical protein